MKSLSKSREWLATHTDIHSLVTMNALATTLFGGLLAVSSAIAETAIISKGSSEWKYLDQGTAPGENWTGIEFADAAWKTGQAPLGYETDDGSALKTTVSFGDDVEKKHAATYFRKSFDIVDLATHPQTALKIPSTLKLILRLPPISDMNTSTIATTPKKTKSADTILGASGFCRFPSMPDLTEFVQRRQVIPKGGHDDNLFMKDAGLRS